MFELLAEFLFNRYGAFLLGVALIVGGVYLWMNYRADVRLYDAATGSDSRTVEATVAWKGEEVIDTNEHGGESVRTYFTIEYPHEGETQRIKKYISFEEYDAHKLNDKITIRYNPANLEYVVTRGTKRESTFWATVFSGGLIVVGLLIIIVVIISLM